MKLRKCTLAGDHLPVKECPVCHETESLDEMMIRWESTELLICPLGRTKNWQVLEIDFDGKSEVHLQNFCDCHRAMAFAKGRQSVTGQGIRFQK